MRRIIRLIITMLALVLTARLVPGIIITNLASGFWAALILGLVNIFIKPILTLFTLPLTIFSFGLFLFVINGVIFLLTARLVTGFTVSGLFSAIFGSILLSIISSLMNKALED